MTCSHRRRSPAGMELDAVWTCDWLWCLRLCSNVTCIVMFLWRTGLYAAVKPNNKTNCSSPEEGDLTLWEGSKFRAGEDMVSPHWNWNVSLTRLSGQARLCLRFWMERWGAAGFVPVNLRAATRVPQFPRARWRRSTGTHVQPLKTLFMNPFHPKAESLCMKN